MAGDLRVNYFAPKVLVLGILIGLVLTACQQAPLVSGRFVSEKGVNIEAAFPADSFLLVKLGTRDEQQLSNLKQLNSYFPNDPLGTVASEFIKGFKEGADLQEVGLDFEKDVLPLLSPKIEMYLIVAPGVSQANGGISAVLAMTLANEGKFDDLLNRQVDKGEMIKEGYNGYSYYTQKDASESPALVARMKDVVFVFTDLQGLKTGLDNVSINNVVLNNNAIYQKAMQEYKSSVAFIFGDIVRTVAFLKQTGPDGGEVVKALSSIGVGDAGVDMIESETIIALLEKDGVRLTASVLGKDGADLTKLSGQVEKSYLAQKIPAKYPVMYSEAYNLKATYESLMKMAANSEPEMKDGLEQMKAFLAEQNLDLEKDILSFLDKGYGFVMEDADSVIPALGFYIDANSNPAGAVKVAQKINVAVEDIWKQAQQENPTLETMISKQEVVSGQLWKFAVNVDSLLVGAPSEVVKKLSGQKIELYYGVLPEKVLVFALKPDLEKVYGKSPNVAEATEYKQALSYLQGADMGVTYLAPSQVFVYVDRLLKVVADAGGKPADLTEYEMIKSYMMPFKSVVTASSGVGKTRISAQAFIHISQ